MTSTTSGAATALRGTPRIFSLDSAKAIKAQGYGYLNAIHYMAPHTTGGVGDLCGHSSAGCRGVCLGKYSGQAAIVLDLEEGTNATRASRVLKAQMFMQDRNAYMNMMAHAIMAVLRKAQREGLTPCIRPNGSTDNAYERIRFTPDATLRDTLHPALRPGGVTLLELFPEVQFVDYTKNPGRMTSPTRPANLHLTFSRSEDNEPECLTLLERGHNVAVVFAHGLPVIRKWKGFPVIDGDRHDLRHLDPQGGYVIGLTPKGNKAKQDMSGFVLRDY